MTRFTTTLTESPPTVRRFDPRLAAVIVTFFGIFLVYFLIDCGRIRKERSGDFLHFYFAARAMLDHTDLYTSGTNGYIYPPLIAFLYTPIARLPYNTAATVMLGINCLLAATAIRLAAGEFVRRFALPRTQLLIWSIALLGAFLDIDKIRNELQMLQTNALMLLMFVLALRWLDRRPILAGAALGVVFNIKYLSLVMLPYLIVRRRWSAVASFLGSCVFFALLPATISGWGANLANLPVAFGGLGHMVGIGSGQQANVEDITALFSSSITSAMARLTKVGVEFSMPIGMFYVALVALITLGVVVALYQRSAFPFLLWPKGRRQLEQPFAALVGLEWAGLITAALVFSPQTNMRHLFLALLVTVPVAGLLLAGRIGWRTRCVLALGTVVTLLGFVLPPGRDPVTLQSSNIRWASVGGPCWCLLALYLTLLSVGLVHVKNIAAGTIGTREEK